MKFTRLMAFILVLTWLLVGCGQAAQPAPSNNESSAPTSSAGSGSGESAASTTDKKLNVVTTVSPITNIVYNVGGDRVNLSGIIPEGVNSHTFEPAPSDAKKLAEADLIFINGLKLEEPSLELAVANKKPDAEIILLGEQTITPDQYIYDFSFPKELGSPNPHLWPNPFHALRYAEIARDAMVRKDPANADYYKVNYDAFKARIEAMDKAFKETINSIPEANRRLLTYHDSWAYFTPLYEMTVIGAIQPSDFAEPSAQDVANLIIQIKQEKVPAIFGSDVFPSPVLEQIAKETGAKYVDKLRDDDLPGLPGDPNHSYVGMMVENVRIMAEALGGNPALIANFDITNIPGPDSDVQQTQ